jgi:uncharacterized protein (TIGR03435 family)
MRYALAALVLAVAAPVASAQAPTFDVVSIKESPPPVVGPGGSISFSMGIGPRPGGRWIAQNATLLRLIQEAFGGFNLPGQIAGAPEWASRTSFEVNAIAAAGTSPETMKEMVKAMLADRFKFRFHIEQRELDVYALVLARPDGRLGPGLKPSTVDCAALAKEGRGGGRPAPGERPQCGSMQQSTPNGTVRYLAGSTTVDSVAGVAQRAAGRPVINRTGLTGRFDRGSGTAWASRGHRRIDLHGAAGAAWAEAGISEGEDGRPRDRGRPPANSGLGERGLEDRQHARPRTLGFLLVVDG